MDEIDNNSEYTSYIVLKFLINITDTITKKQLIINKLFYERYVGTNICRCGNEKNFYHGGCEKHKCNFINSDNLLCNCYAFNGEKCNQHLQFRGIQLNCIIHNCNNSAIKNNKCILHIQYETRQKMKEENMSLVYNRVPLSYHEQQRRKNNMCIYNQICQNKIFNDYNMCGYHYRKIMYPCKFINNKNILCKYPAIINYPCCSIHYTFSDDYENYNWKQNKKIRRRKK